MDDYVIIEGPDMAPDDLQVDDAQPQEKIDIVDDITHWENVLEKISLSVRKIVNDLLSDGESRALRLESLMERDVSSQEHDFRKSKTGFMRRGHVNEAVGEAVTEKTPLVSQTSSPELKLAQENTNNSSRLQSIRHDLENLFSIAETIQAMAELSETVSLEDFPYDKKTSKLGRQWNLINYSKLCQITLESAITAVDKLIYYEFLQNCLVHT